MAYDEVKNGVNEGIVDLHHQSVMYEVIRGPRDGMWPWKWKPLSRRFPCRRKNTKTVFSHRWCTTETTYAHSVATQMSLQASAHTTHPMRHCCSADCPPLVAVCGGSNATANATCVTGELHESGWVVRDWQDSCLATENVNV